MNFNFNTVDSNKYNVSTKSGNLDLIRVTNLVEFFDHRKKQVLENWRSNNKDHLQISNNARNRGTKIHKFLEHHANSDFSKLETVFSTFNLDEQCRIKHLKKEVLDYINIIHSEIKLIYLDPTNTYGYAGTADLFFKFAPNHTFKLDGLDFINPNSLYIGDFKTKNAACNNECYLLSYALQLAFYSNAYKYVYGEDVEGGFIFYNSPKKTTIYYLPKHNLDYFINECLDILDCYHYKREYDFESMKRRVGINTYLTKENRSFEKLSHNHKLFYKITKE